MIQHPRFSLFFIYERVYWKIHSRHSNITWKNSTYFLHEPHFFLDRKSAPVIDFAVSTEQVFAARHQTKSARHPIGGEKKLKFF